MAISTTNDFLVGVNGIGQLTFMRPLETNRVVDREKALRLAAYIVAMIDDVAHLGYDSSPSFAEILEAVQNS